LVSPKFDCKTFRLIMFIFKENFKCNGTLSFLTANKDAARNDSIPF